MNAVSPKLTLRCTLGYRKQIRAKCVAVKHLSAVWSVCADLRTVIFWINGGTASAFRRRPGRTCSSAWSWSLSCSSGKRLFRWPRSWRWRGYRWTTNGASGVISLWFPFDREAFLMHFLFLLYSARRTPASWRATSWDSQWTSAWALCASMLLQRWVWAYVASSPQTQ